MNPDEDLRERARVLHRILSILDTRDETQHAADPEANKRFLFEFMRDIRDGNPPPIEVLKAGADDLYRFYREDRIRRHAERYAKGVRFGL